MRATQIARRTASKLFCHVLACIDGEKEPPRWLHRSHRVGYLAYYGTAALGLAHAHERIVWIVLGALVLSFFVGMPHRIDEEAE